MRFGVFCDLRNPAPWRRPPDRHYRQALETIAMAESLGAEAVWLSEHHGFEDGYLPQPLTMAAAVAARTETVRVGTAILIAALRHPVHVAEEAAVVDLVSGGRLELGIGAGYAAHEYATFGVDLARRFELTDASVVAVREALASGTVRPAPLQDPLPVWLGYQGPKGARRAGRLGVGLLSLDHRLLEPYRDGLVEGGHDPETARMGGVVDLVVADDPPAAARRILPHYVHQQNTYRAIMRGPDGQPLAPLDPERVRQRLEARGSLPGLAVHDVDGAAAAIRERVADLPVAHVYFWASIAGMPDDLVGRHLELLFSDVVPRVRGALR